MKNDPQIRYKLRQEERFFIYFDCPGTSTNAIGVCLEKQEDVFVDILEETDMGYKIRAYFQDKPVVGYVIEKQFSGLIEIHNKELLLDGRFNSDRLA